MQIPTHFEMGATLHTGDLSMEQLLQYGREAESLGYRGFWLTEESGKEAFATLALLAQATSKIRLGTGIVNFYSRSPTLLAMAATTIDRLSGGRFDLGIGTGGVGFMERGHGITIEKPLRRARETAEIVRGLLDGGSFSYEGQWFSPRDFHLREGGSGGRIPIYFSALNPKMVGQAVRSADGFISNWLTEESLADLRGIIATEAEKAGKDPAKVKILTLLMTCVDPQDDAAVKAMRRGLAFYFASQHYHHIAEISGFGAEAKQIKAVWERKDFDGATAMVSDAMVEKFSLTGSPAACRKKLRWLGDAGVYPIIYPLPRRASMLEDHLATVRLAAQYAQEEAP